MRKLRHARLRDSPGHTQWSWVGASVHVQVSIQWSLESVGHLGRLSMKGGLAIAPKWTCREGRWGLCTQGGYGVSM